MIYLDNSATTHIKPKSVFNIAKHAKRYSFNAGRGGHTGSVKTGLALYKTREYIRDSFNLKKAENVIFTSGCTSALNLAIMGSVKQGGHIVTTYQEHNSVLRTLYHLKSQKIITYSIAKPKVKGQIELSYEDIISKVKPSTYLMIINQTSNVTGNTIELEKLGKYCKQHKILLLVDGAQSVGHIQIDMQKLNINMLAIAGHKGLYALTGVGCLLVNNVKLKPITFGGTGSMSHSLVQPLSYPDGFEAGTCSPLNILSLREGLLFVNKHFDKINNKIAKLSQILLDYLSTNKKVVLYSNNAKSGVISFNIKGMSSTDVGDILNEKYKIYVRCGLHCAPMVHKTLGTCPDGMVRVSISYFNTTKDIKTLIKALKKIIS